MRFFSPSITLTPENFNNAKNRHATGLVHCRGVRGGGHTLVRRRADRHGDRHGPPAGEHHRLDHRLLRVLRRALHADFPPSARAATPGGRTLFVVSALGFGINEATYAWLLHATALRYDVLLALVLIGIAGMTFILGRYWAFRHKS
jgi:hypothetical protein